MATVHTVRGPVDSTELGPTLPHEHVFIMQPEALENYGHVWGEAYWNEEAALADAARKLQTVVDAGIRTLVDPTAPGLGRNIRRIQRLNERVDLNIVVATGLYAFIELPNFFRYRQPEAIAEFFVRELTEGIDDTGIRAMFLKCAVEEYGVVGDVPKILRAIAIASNETGAPIMVHTNAAARTGLLALDALEAEGADLSRVQIAHVGDSNDMDYIDAIYERGAWLGLDRFGIEAFNPTQDRIETLLKLLESDRADRCLLSHDAACFMDFFIGDPRFAGEEPDYLLVWNTVLPALREAGVAEEAINRMTVETPRRFLELGSS